MVSHPRTENEQSRLLGIELASKIYTNYFQQFKSNILCNAPLQLWSCSRVVNNRCNILGNKSYNKLETLFPKIIGCRKRILRCDSVIHPSKKQKIYIYVVLLNCWVQILCNITWSNGKTRLRTLTFVKWNTPGFMGCRLWLYYETLMYRTKPQNNFVVVLDPPPAWLIDWKRQGIKTVQIIQITFRWYDFT